MNETNYFTNCINNNKQIIFAKFGDGEYYTCQDKSPIEVNCDEDSCTSYLGKHLKKSFKYLVSINCLIGKWEHQFVIDFFNSLITNKNNINWINYAVILNRNEYFNKPYLLNFVKSIQETNYKKIIITNYKNLKLKELFKTNFFIEVPSKNWFINYKFYLNKIKDEIIDVKTIIFTAAGMGSKVLIAKLLKNFPLISCIDIGSSFDFLCQKKPSRDQNYSYDEEYNYYKNILPDNW